MNDERRELEHQKKLTEIYKSRMVHEVELASNLEAIIQQKNEEIKFLESEIARLKGSPEKEVEQ